MRECGSALGAARCITEIPTLQRTFSVRDYARLLKELRLERHGFCRFTVAMPLTSAHSTWPKPRVLLRAQRWILGTLAMSAVFWLVALCRSPRARQPGPSRHTGSSGGQTPLLKSRPTLIFAGESRTAYQIDPVLAAQPIGKPPGAVVNLGYDAGEPLALLAAMRRKPGAFRDADTVVSVAPFL